MVFLHGFVKKSQQTPANDLMSTHIGSSFDDFLEEENLLTNTTAEALKRVLAWQIKNFLKLLSNFC